MAFTGLPKEMRTFYRNIGENRHSKAWFDAHRDDYETYAQGPMRALAADVAEAVLYVDETLDTRPARAVSRIRRDTRWSRDKSLYRDHLWAAFRQTGSSVSDGLCLYFETERDQIAWGMGFYMATPRQMAGIREAILENPARFEKLAADPRVFSVFALEGEDYRRPPAGCEDAPGVLVPWLMKKSVALTHAEPYGPDAETPELAGRMSADFRALKPLYEFIAKASAPTA